MRALPLLPVRNLALALPAFFSPSIVFLSLMLADRAGLKAPPDALVASLFYVTPPLGLLACGLAVWLAPLAPRLKVVAFTVATGAMVVQFALLLALMVAASA
jgi:hypothetical protein